MRISAVTACSGYAAILERGLARWRDGCDALVVATPPTDQDTIALCLGLGVPVVLTDAFTRDGDWFNKAAAMNDALAAGVIPWDDWGLFFDADIVPALGWRSVVECSEPDRVCLYGAARHLEDGSRVKEQPGGFFQLFHTSAPQVQRRPILDAVTGFGGYPRGFCHYDLEFMNRWPASQRRVFDALYLTHIGSPGSGVRRFLDEKKRGGIEQKTGRPYVPREKRRRVHA